MTKQKFKLKKNEKGPGSSSATHIKGKDDSRECPSGVVDDRCSPPVLTSSKGHGKVSFVPEIQNMMYALGDCRKPVHDTTVLVEQIVRQQVTLLLRSAADVCVMRGARFIGIEDFIYLMKSDHQKLHKLFQFLLFKDAKPLKMATDDIEPTVSTPDQKGNKRRRVCQEFLTIIDQTGELTDILESEDVDGYRIQRQERQEQETRNMDLSTYQEYSEARRVHFLKKMSKFKEWVDAHNLDPKPSSFALEILCHLAYETVAEIVELSLLVRRDMLASPTDPLSQTMAPVCVNDLPSLGMNLSHAPLVGSSPPSTPLHSPRAASPASPQEKMLSPFLSASGSGQAVSGNSNNSDSSNQGDVKPGTPVGGVKSKSKKKKKKEEKKLFGSPHSLGQHRGIQPSHIKEAVRRFQDSSGPMAAFSKVISHGEKIRYFTC